MKISTHRYILPPVLLGIHLVLLLPLVASRPDLRAFSGPNAPQHPTSTLYIRNALSFGFAGFAFAYLLKQIVGRIPLPSTHRRRRLAEWLERAMLFGMGAVEEVWRYGVVHVLVHMQSKSDDPSGVTRVYRAGWETVYLMGWVWSIIECSVRTESPHGVNFVTNGSIRCLGGTADRIAALSTSQCRHTIRLHASAHEHDGQSRLFLRREYLAVMHPRLNGVETH